MEKGLRYIDILKTMNCRDIKLMPLWNACTTYIKSCPFKKNGKISENLIHTLKHLINIIREDQKFI